MKQVKKRTIAGCTGKRRHFTMTEAIKARDALKRKFPSEQFVAYQCWCCKQWHTGSVQK